MSTVEHPALRTTSSGYRRVGGGGLGSRRPCAGARGLGHL